jgi:outer membrane immunogenic protein
LRTRLHQALALTALLTASATASSPVLSADLPPAPLPPAYQQAPLPSQNVFEGWYLGSTIGGATVNYDLAPASGSVDTSGVLGGGWSWQSGPIVLGIEGDFLGADVSGSRHFNAGFNQVSPNIDMMADLRLRAGYAITPRVLVFGTFGGAWTNADLPVTGIGGGSGDARAGAQRSRLTRIGARASTISSPISAWRRSIIQAASSISILTPTPIAAR